MHPVTRSRRPAVVRPLARHARRLLAVGGLGTGLAALAIGAAVAPAAATDARPQPGRQIQHYTVRPGDTATELAVRFHAWTAELVAHNHLGSNASLVTGQRIEIPVVTSALPAGERSRKRTQDPGQQRTKHAKRDRKRAERKAERRAERKAERKAERRAERKAERRRDRRAGHSVTDPERARVRDELVAASRHYGVEPELALAVSWQEAGWKMHHVSGAGAIGAMQVLPSTGEWMEPYAGRELDLRNLRDNAAAGVLLLDVLRGMTDSLDHRIGAYYQGPSAVRDHGLYPETRRYVANVKAIKRQLDRGNSPG